MIKVVSVENMRKSDAHTIEHSTSAKELMFRAGSAIFEAVEWKPPVAIVCGEGNNAGDGYVVAGLLKNAGIYCELFLLTDKFSVDGRHYFENCEAIGIKINRGIGELNLNGFNTVLDCIFGTGFKGVVAEPFSTAINMINSTNAYIVSADINSGLGGDSGLAGNDNFCVRSDLTVSVGQYKSGHFLNSAKDVIKNKINREIGIEPADTPAYLIESSDIRHIFERTTNNTHKGDYGYVAIVGGSVEYSGAAKLANLAMSALRSGAGVAKLAVPRSISLSVLPYILESTVFELDEFDGKYCFSNGTASRLLNRTRAVSVGMGMGCTDEIKSLFEYMFCEYSGRLIIDADGLSAFAEMDKKYLKNASCKIILTPHLKEFERLCGQKIEDFRTDLITAAKEYANLTGTILLLKGSTTIITDGTTTYLTDRGCPGMATAGSGDVLSGILTGICGYVPENEILLGTAAGAYLNGLAGEIASKTIPPVSMIAGDTIKKLPEAVKCVLEGGEGGS